MPRNEDVERVAETHFFIREQIVRSLGQTRLTPEGQAWLGRPYSTYLELWQGTFADRFFDMATMIRLGSAIETGLRHYHSQFKGPTQRGTFYQRLVKPAELVATFKADCSYHLITNAAWGRMREIMVQRHLYAHRSGLADDRYINDMQQVCGEDIRPRLAALGYPQEEVYWFEPLKRLPEYIEDARRFFRDLPDPGAE